MAATGSETLTGKCFSSNCSISVARTAMVSSLLGSCGRPKSFANSALAFRRSSDVRIGLMATVFLPGRDFGQMKRLVLYRGQENHIVSEINERNDADSGDRKIE